MPASILFNSVNFSGLSANLLFYPLTGGFNNFGTVQMPYTHNPSDYYFGTYEFVFPTYNKTCQVLVQPPAITPTNTATPTITPTNSQTPNPTPTITSTPSVTPSVTTTEQLTQTPTASPTPTPTPTPTSPVSLGTTLTQDAVGAGCTLCGSGGISMAFGLIGTTITFTPLASPGTLPSNLFIYQSGVLIGRISVTSGYRTSPVILTLNYGGSTYSFSSNGGTAITVPAVGFRIDI